MPSSAKTGKKGSKAVKLSKESVGKAPKTSSKSQPQAQPKSILKNNKEKAVEEPSSEDDEEEGDEEEELSDDNDDGDISDDADAEDSNGSSAHSDDSDTYADLKPKKRKRKTNETEANAFAAALTNLADSSTAASKNLEILPQANKSLKKHRLQLKAQKVLRDEAKHKEDIGRVRDVVAGWAVPSTAVKTVDGVEVSKEDGDGGDKEAVIDAGAGKEKRLRKVAQKGVVRLFNAILAAQKAETGAKSTDKEKDKGLGKQRLEAPANFPSQQPKKKDTKNVVAKQAFMDAIRKG